MRMLCIFGEDIPGFMVARHYLRRGWSYFTVRNGKGTKLKFCQPERLETVSTHEEFLDEIAIERLLKRARNDSEA